MLSSQLQPKNPIPDWVPAADRALSGALSRVRMIALSTPKNYRTELDRITEHWVRGQAEPPRFAYEPAGDFDGLRRALDALAEGLDREGPLGAIYAARARELSDEAAICGATGEAGFWQAARKRFARRDRFDDEADVVVESWLSEGNPPEEDETELVRTDDEQDARSLLVRMRQEIGRRKLPVRVAIGRDMASLAAAGDGFVQVVSERWITPRDVERTVLHEIDGHVVPRVRSTALPLGIFAIGTARGTDDQEGRALALERANGQLDARRRKELALRHIATRSVERGAPFVETTRRLLDCRATISDAVRVAGRAHRGGGLGREAVYVPALLRVEASLQEDAELDRVIGAGRVAVFAASALRPWAV